MSGIVEGPGLPPKVSGRHRWMLSAIVPLTDNEASAVNSGAAFTAEADRLLIIPAVTCLDCEGHYDELAGAGCPVTD